MKSSNLYLGITELVAVLTPGILTAFAIVALTDGTPFFAIEGFTDITIFLLLSFLIGLIMVGVGNKLDSLANFFQVEGAIPEEDEIGKIRDQVKGQADGEAAQAEDKPAPISHFDWCCSLLVTDHPDAYLSVASKEAEAKLFRSMLLPLAFWMVYGGTTEDSVIGLIGLVLLITCFLGFSSQRKAARVMAYAHVSQLASRGRL